METRITTSSSTAEPDDPAPFLVDFSSLRQPRERWPFGSYLSAIGSLLGLYLAFSVYFTLIILMFWALGRSR